MVRWIGGNVGSFNPIEVRFEIHERCADILNSKGDIDGASFCEARVFDLPCSPIVNDGPFQSNGDNLRSHQHGVMSYANAEFRPNILDIDCTSICNQDLEIIACIVTSNKIHGRKKGSKTHKTLLIYVYRNFCVPSSDLRDGINSVIAFARRVHNCYRLIIHGDLNDENFTMLRDDIWNAEPAELTHKHRVTSRPTRIDKIMTNVRDLKVTVYRSVETYATTNPECGHKLYTLEFDVPKLEPKIGTHLDLGQLQAELTATDNSGVPMFSSDPVDSIQRLNLEAAEFCGRTQDLVLKCSRKTSRNPNSHKHVSMDEVTAAVLSPDRTKSNPFKQLYDFVNNHREPALLRDEDKEAPSPADLKSGLEKKFAEVKEANNLIARQTIEKLHQPAKKIIATFPEAIFEELVLSTNNSKSKDLNGISLKTGKFIVKNSSVFMNQLKRICRASTALGHFPDAFKQDKIIFIWKRKGKKSDPGMWR